MGNRVTFETVAQFYGVILLLPFGRQNKAHGFSGSAQKKAAAWPERLVTSLPIQENSERGE